MIYFPNNIFAKNLSANLPSELQSVIKYSPSALLVKNVISDKENVGLIPTTDIINNKNLFVSKNFGISFEGSLSNGYIHFKKDETKVSELFLMGDVSSIDVILSKILFKRNVRRRGSN